MWKGNIVIFLFLWYNFFVGDIMEMYEVKKNVDKIKRGGYTFFLMPNICKEVSYRLNKKEYNLYYPYPESDKVIMYSNKIPKVKLYEIISYYPITHREILGSLFALNISNEAFGDIVIDNGKYYFYVMDEIASLIENDFSFVGNKPIKIKEIDIHTLDNYKRLYEENEIIVSSLRVDTIISRIIGTSRDKIKDKIKDKDILVNYEILSNNSYVLKENDIFSIRKYGKYKYIGIIKNTKKDNYIIKYLKYI